MPRHLRVRIGLVAVVVAVSLWYLYPLKSAINLGLDLQGGIHLMLGVRVMPFDGPGQIGDLICRIVERIGFGIRLDWIIRLAGFVMVQINFAFEAEFRGGIIE